MEGWEVGLANREHIDIVWVGRSDLDAYWDRCSGSFPIALFDNIYEAVARALTGLDAKILVLNAIFLGSELKSTAKAVLAQGLFQRVLIYSPAHHAPYFSPNGDIRVMMVNHPDQLADCLTAVLPREAAEVPAVEEPREAGKIEEDRQVGKEEPQESAVPADWPGEAPIIEKDHTVRVEEPAIEPAPAPAEAKNTEEIVPPTPEEHQQSEPEPKPPQKEFQAAELTREELQALLGPDFQPEKEEE